jgi:hypothetical protein
MWLMILRKGHGGDFFEGCDRTLSYAHVAWKKAPNVLIVIWKPVSKYPVSPFTGFAPVPRSAARRGRNGRISYADAHKRVVDTERLAARVYARPVLIGEGRGLPRGLADALSEAL